MIVVAGQVAVNPDERAAAVAAATEMAEATRREDGCISYRFSADLADPNTFLIFEEWESDDALARHFQTEHMRRFRERLPAFLAGAPVIRRYVVESVSALV